MSSIEPAKNISQYDQPQAQNTTISLETPLSSDQDHLHISSPTDLNVQNSADINNNTQESASNSASCDKSPVPPIFIPSAVSSSCKPLVGLGIQTPNLQLLEDQKNRRIVLDISGQLFFNSEHTLLQAKDSLFSDVLSPTNTTFCKTGEKGRFFFDRDSTHFRFILNHLRNGAQQDPDSLPKDKLVLFELLHEARYYRLRSLEASVLLRMHELQRCQLFGSCR